MRQSIVKGLCALLALCLMLAAPVAALAEPEQGTAGDTGELVQFVLDGSDGAAQAQAQGEPLSAADEETWVADAEASLTNDAAEEEEYDEFGFNDDQEFVVSDRVAVDDLAITQGLDEDWTNILLLGSDARSDKKYLRTDTMIVLSLNAKTNQAKMTSIMRDIWVEIPGFKKQKLNVACVYGGPELTIRTINQYFGLNIEKYALVNMQCLVAIVDALGGLELDVTPAESAAIRRLNASSVGAKDGSGRYVSQDVPSGSNVTLDGKQVLAYSRIRKSDSDYARTSRQRTVLVALARKLQQKSMLEMAGVAASMLQYVETNLRLNEILDIAATCMNLDLNDLSEFRIPADGTYESGMYGRTWCIKPDFEANAEALHQFIYG